MERESIIEAPRGTSRAGFFTPASAPSLLVELESQPLKLSALPPSTALSQTECMPSTQGMAKTPHLPDRIVASQQDYSALCSPAKSPPDSQTKLSHATSIRYAHAIPSTPPAEACSSTPARQTSVNGCSLLLGRARVGARTVRVVERGRHGNRIHVRAPTEFGERVKCSEGEQVESFLVTKELQHFDFDGRLKGSVPATLLAVLMDEPERADHSLSIPEGYNLESSRPSVAVTSSKACIQSPNSTIVRTEGRCPRSTEVGALPRLGTLSLEEACVGSNIHRIETSASLCRLGKCGSTASTVCTADSEPLLDALWDGKRERRRLAHSHTSNSSECENIEGLDSGPPKCAFRPTLTQMPPSQQQKLGLGEVETCAAPIKDENSTRAVPLILAAGACGGPELPCGHSQVAFTTINSTEALSREGSIPRTGNVLARPEAPERVPMRSEPDESSLSKVSMRGYGTNACNSLYREEELGTQTTTRLSCSSSRHYEKLSFVRNCESKKASPCNFGALRSRWQESVDAPYKENTFRGPSIYAEPAKIDSGALKAGKPAVIRTTPTFRTLHRVFKPSSSIMVSHVFYGEKSAGEPYDQQGRLLQAKPCQNPHSRKLPRYTECAECVPSSANLETHALSTRERCCHTSTPSTYTLPACRLQESPGLNFQPALHKDRNADAKSSDIFVAREQHPRATSTHPTSSSRLSLLRTNSSKRDQAVSLPQSGREIVKVIGNHLSSFERGEILDYEEVWYWGKCRTPRSSTLQEPNNCNAGFDDSRGDYLAYPGDHVCYRFEVLTALGRGSFGQVFKAYDHKKHEHVALKIIRNKSHFHSQGRIEIQVLQELVHHDTDNRANVIHMKEHYMFRNHLIITFELLSLNVYDFLKRNSFRGLSPLAVRSIAIQLLQALRLLRRQRIVHCDLKPENIVLKNVHKSGVKVIDFGSSCREGEARYSYIQSRFYRSPEVMLGLTYSCAIDMWSLGCILAELQTGQPLFPGENEADQINCVMEVLGPPPDYLVSQSPKKKLFFKANGEPKILASPHGKKRKTSSRSLNSALRTDELHFVEFIRGKKQENATQTRLNKETACAFVFEQDVATRLSQDQMNVPKLATLPTCDQAFLVRLATTTSQTGVVLNEVGLSFVITFMAGFAVTNDDGVGNSDTRTLPKDTKDLQRLSNSNQDPVQEKGAVSCDDVTVLAPSKEFECTGSSVCLPSSTNGSPSLTRECSAILRRFADASGLQLSHPEGAASLEDSPSLLLLYISAWEAPHVHYRGNDGIWTGAPGIRMREVLPAIDTLWTLVPANLRREATRSKLWAFEASSRERLELLPNDGHNRWDKPPGGGHYTVATAGRYLLHSGCIRSLGCPPSAPALILCLQVGSSYAKIAWNPPVVGGEEIRGYNVYSIEISWKAPADHGGAPVRYYCVYRDGLALAYIPAIGGDKFQYIDTTVCPLQTCTYRVSALHDLPSQRLDDCPCPFRSEPATDDSGNAWFKASVSGFSLEGLLSESLTATAVDMLRAPRMDDEKSHILLQGFNWVSCRNPHGWYAVLLNKLPDIKRLGATIIWLPPPTESVAWEGYMPTRWYNLNSKYGSAEELKNLIREAATKYQLSCCADVVANHRSATKQDQNGHWTIYEGPDWGPWAVVCNNLQRYKGEGNHDTGTSVDCAPDIDHTNVQVQCDVKNWLRWLVDEIGFTAVRLDMAGGYGVAYQVACVIMWFFRNVTGAEQKSYVDSVDRLFAVGEYWDGNTSTLANYVRAGQGSLAAFDFAFYYVLKRCVESQNFTELNVCGRLSGLLGVEPRLAVTFIENHDTDHLDYCSTFGGGDLDAVLQGYAVILTHPGIPSVYWNHFSDYGPYCRQKLQELCDVRLNTRIQSTSGIFLARAEWGLYSAYISPGSPFCLPHSASVAMKVGYNDWAPEGSGWKIATYGTRFCVWSR